MMMTAMIVMMIVSMIGHATPIAVSLAVAVLRIDKAAPFNMVMVAFLRRTHLILETNDLNAIFAHLAIH